MTELVTIFFDGGSRGNPGPAAGAAHTVANGGLTKTHFLAHATNNEAEYWGLILAARIAKENGFQNVLFKGDSKLVVSQLTGEWKVKSEVLGGLLAEAKREIASLPRWRIEWIPREENGLADRAANEAMDSSMGIVEVPEDEAELLRENIRPDIAALNALGKKAGFSDLRKLKVGGMDEYSKANREVLTVLIPSFALLESSFLARVKADPAAKKLGDLEAQKLVMGALRWVARGLKGELAIRKVLIDHENAMKMRDAKR